MCGHTLRPRRWPPVAVLGILLTLAPGVLLTVAPGTAIAAVPHAASRLACAAALPRRAVVDQPGWPQTRYGLATMARISQGEGVTVAVLDSGVDATHPQLAGAVRAGGDMLDPTGDGLEDCLGHGTAMASIIAARPVAGAGLVGLAPRATILSIRVSSRIETSDGYVGTGDVAALVSGIDRAISATPRPAVLNLSLSTRTDSPALRAVIERALAADIVVVAAVGNAYDRGNPTPFPAAYPGVVGVGAVDATGARLDRSQTGPYVDIVAPGDAVLAAAPGAGHDLVSGTSPAVAYVSGTAVLIRARWPELDRASVVRRLLATADPPAGAQPSPGYGYGVVNPLRALTEVLPTPAAAAGGTPAPAVRPATADGADPAPAVTALATAAALLLATLLVTALALVAPQGRRRRWRPGDRGEHA